MIKNVDVAIVGGGPAGMIAACLLAREGIKTLVLEKNEDFDREFRGEILQPRFLQAIKDADLFEHLNKYPHEEIAGAQVYFHHLKVGQIEAKRIDGRNPQIWWMTQPHILNGFHDYAKRFENYDILFKAPVKELHPGPKLIVSHNRTDIEVNAKVVLAADGRFSSIKRLGHFETQYDHHDLDVVWFILERPENYQHFFSFFLGLTRAFLILPKHPNQLQCGMVFRPGEFVKQKSKGIEAFKQRLASHHPLFVEYARQVKDFSNFHLLKGNRALVKDWVKNGVVLIGDSAHTCTPVGGIGVAIATETAVVAAQNIIEGLKNNNLSDSHLRKIQQQRIRQVKNVHIFQGQARFMLNPFFMPIRIFIPLIIPLLSFFKIIPLFARRMLAQQRSLGSDYDGKLQVKEALDLYFKRSGFGRETYTNNFIKLPAGPFNFYLPNIKPRKDVVPLHDVDHVVAEYSTDWKGELEISAFELGMGLNRYWMGWLIDLQGIWLSILLYPLKSFKAFARGRRTKCFYKIYGYNESLLNSKLEEIRSHIGIPKKHEVKPNILDFLNLLSLLVLSLIVHSPILIVAYLAYKFLITWAG